MKNLVTGPFCQRKRMTETPEKSPRPIIPLSNENTPPTMLPPDSSLSEHSLGLPAGYKLEEYRILETLGRGGFGITYLAEDTRMRVKVAIKELFPDEFAARAQGEMVVPRRQSDIADFAWAKDRFDKEAATLIRLTHPNIVRVFRLFEKNNTAYIVMEYVAGKNFKDWIRDHPQPAEAALRDVLFPLLDGLEYVHRQGFLHRDISPENVRFTEDDRPLLVDFGNARALKGAHKTVVIKHGFSPIEQYQTAGVQEPYTDIYALAGVMIYALTGETPPLALDRSNQRDPHQPLVQRFRGQYSDAFLKALDWGFAIKPKERPQTVADWRRRLTAKPPPRPGAWPLIILSLAVIGLLGAAALWVLLPHNRRIMVPGDYRTIQAAINAAKANDTVYVKSGTYNEAVKFKGGITLEGEDPATTIVRYSAPPTAIVGQEHFDSPLEIRDCKSGTILNLSFHQDGIDMRDTSDGKTWKTDAITIWNSSVVLKNCRATSLAYNGIGIYRDSVVSLVENQCRSNKWNGISFATGSHGTARDNICEENDRDGIDVIGADPDLENNRCISNKEDGIYFALGANGKAIENICKENGNYGIQVYGTTAELTKNECSLNQYSGIIYRFRATGKASENVCRQNAKNGIELSSSSPSLMQNELVKNSSYGISYDADCNPTLSDNRYNGNEKGQVYAATKLVRRLGTLPTPTMSPTPSPLSTPVQTPTPNPTPFHFPSPFHLISPGPFDFSTPTPTPVPTPARLVVPDQYRTIQAAINAAKSGDTVYVRHGTYNEALKFKEGITLNGEDPETTIVRYSTPPTATLEQTHYDSPLEVRDCKAGTITNLTFRQDQADTRTGGNIWKSDAITIWHSSATIKNCRTTSAAASGIAVCRWSTVTLTGNQSRSNASCGISFSSGSNGTAEDNLCENNAFHGIYMYGEGTTVHLRKNVCQGNASCGISFESGTHGEAIQNTCRQNKWDGIAVNGASPVLTFNVLVKNSRYGIWCNAEPKPFILGNEFDSNGSGEELLLGATPTPTPRPSSTPAPTPTPDPFQLPFPSGSPFGGLAVPSPFTLATPTRTPVTAPSPKPSPSASWLATPHLFSPSPTSTPSSPKPTPNDWWLSAPDLFSPSPTPATGQPKK
jgi:parallel beta-helix repeat protein